MTAPLARCPDCLSPSGRGVVCAGAAPCGGLECIHQHVPCPSCVPFTPKPSPRDIAFREIIQAECRRICTPTILTEEMLEQARRPANIRFTDYGPGPFVPFQIVHFDEPEEQS